MGRIRRSCREHARLVARRDITGDGVQPDAQEGECTTFRANFHYGLHSRASYHAPSTLTNVANAIALYRSCSKATGAVPELPPAKTRKLRLSAESTSYPITRSAYLLALLSSREELTRNPGQPYLCYGHGARACLLCLNSSSDRPITTLLVYYTGSTSQLAYNSHCMDMHLFSLDIQFNTM